MKNTKLYRHNLTHEFCVEEIKEILALNGQYYSTISVRCVAIKDEKEISKWRNALCVIKVLPKKIVAKKFNSGLYDNIYLLEDWLKPDNLIDFITEFKNGIIKIADIDVNIENPDLRQVQYLHESSWPESLPGYLYSTYAGGQRINIPNDPLINHESPFYPNPQSAIMSWCEISDFHGASDARIGTIGIFLPECRAYFEKLEFKADKNRLYIKISRKVENLSLYLRGAYLTTSGFYRIDRIVEKNKVDIKVEKEVAGNLQDFEIYLIDADDNILDYHQERRFTAKRRLRIFDITVKKEQDDPIKRVLKTGENEKTEFKLFIKKGDKKINELIETVIAFANTRGGTVVIGINDYVVPIGIEKEIQRSGRKKNQHIELSIKEYIGCIKKELSDKLNRIPQLNMYPHYSEGHYFVIIDVSEGSEKPYANIQTKTIYIRKGSNNVKPDPDTELPKLIPGKKEYPEW